MIFDEIAQIMNEDTARKMADKTGLSTSKVYRLQTGCPFYLDYNTIFGLKKLGYTLEITKKEFRQKNK